MSLFQMPASVLTRTGPNWWRWIAFVGEVVGHARLTAHEQRLLNAYVPGESFAQTEQGPFAVIEPPSAGKPYWLLDGGKQLLPSQIKRIGNKWELFDR